MDGSIFIGIRKPIIYSFSLGKPIGFEIISEPEKIHY